MLRNKINGKGYVGITIRTLNQRISGHKKDTNRGSTLSIHSAIRKYGFDNFETIILEECVDIETLYSRETYWINYHNTYKSGYNETLGNRGTTGRVMSEEQKLTMSKMRKGKTRPGIKHTEETKRKIAAKAKQRFIDLGYGPTKGIPCSDKAKKLLSERTKGLVRGRCYTYEVVTPEKQSIIVTNMGEFCRINKLSAGNIHGLISGKIKYYKGYSVKRVEQ